MPRPPKLRKKNGYWMTKAGGTETYFGKVSEVPYKQAQGLFREHLKRSGDARTRKSTIICLEVCDRHLEWVQKHRSKDLYKQRLHFLERWCSFEVGNASKRACIGDLPYIHVTKADLDAWLDHLRSEALGESSVGSGLTAVKACWNWAADDDDDGPFPLDFRPFASVPKIKLPPKALTEEDLLTGDEIDQLFKWADCDLGKIRGENGRYRQRRPDEYRRRADNPYAGFEDILHCYYHTGARTSEPAQCRVGDLLRRTRQIVLGKHKRTNTERERTIRRITLNDEAFDVFERHCHGKSADDYIFTQSNGSPWNKDRLVDRFGKVRELAAVRHTITIYNFRHLWISEALMAGNDIVTVAKMSGTSIKMVEKVYGHFRNEHFELAQQKLDQDRQRRNMPT